jgi:Zn ribbon nucleic-acid-binding protein
MEHYGNLEFATKKELFKFLTENREKLIAQKKAVKKESDCPVIVAPIIVSTKKEMGVFSGIREGKESLKVVCVINTTNFLDSHNDLHLPGIWTKSIKENKMIMHLQEHEMEFDKIISDGEDLKVYTKVFKWSELGYPFEGTTEALVFESTILRKRNEYMLEQYLNGWVKNHSVGMYYVKMDIAINDKECLNEYEAWKKYYPEIANKEVADERGYFFYVMEAKCAEGSAVPLGSNTATPTISIGKAKSVCPDCSNEFDYNSVPESGMGYVNCPKCGKPVSQKDQPGNTTDKNIEPVIIHSIDYSYLLKKLKTN